MKYNNYLKKYGKNIINIIEILSLFIIGLILIFNTKLFIETYSLLILIFMLIYTISNLIQIFINIMDINKLRESLLKFAICIIILLTFEMNFNPFINIIPVSIFLYSMLMGFMHIITFWQYRKDYSFKKINEFLSFIICLIFGYFILINLDLSLTICGAYLIVYSVNLLILFIDEMIPTKNKNKIKNKIHISLPIFISAFIPNRVLININRHLEPKKDIILKDFKNNKHKANVEILVHVTPSGNESFGHCDICINDTIISYGGYDYNSIKFNYTYGPGVMFEAKNKEKYIKFCQKTSNKSIFGFGLYFNKEQMKKLNNKIDELKQRCYSWKCPVQVNNKDCNDYSSLLHLETNAKFYKFKYGKFKYYFVLGFNCVKFVDEILRACDLDTIISGIISPGTYYDFLNREFNKKNGIVISKTIYFHKSKKK